MTKWDYSWDPVEFKKLPDQERESFMTDMITSLTRFVYAQHIKGLKETNENLPRLKRSASALAIPKAERLNAKSMPEEFAEVIDMATSTTDLSEVISKATMTIEKGLRKFTESLTAMNVPEKDSRTSKDDSPINYRSPGPSNRMTNGSSDGRSGTSSDRSRSTMKRSTIGSSDRNVKELTTHSAMCRSLSPKKRTANASTDVRVGKSTTMSVNQRTSSPMKSVAPLQKVVERPSTSPVKQNSSDSSRQVPNARRNFSTSPVKYRTSSPTKQAPNGSIQTTTSTTKYRTSSPTKQAPNGPVMKDMEKPSTSAAKNRDLSPMKQALNGSEDTTSPSSSAKYPLATPKKTMTGSKYVGDQGSDKSNSKENPKARWRL